MPYQISRNGQMYGPYTLEDLQRYVASGNVLATDLAKSEEMTEWLPVSQILASPAAAAAAVPPAFSNPSFAAPADPGPVYGNPAYATPMTGAALAASPYPDAPNLHWGLVLLFSFLTCGLFMMIWNVVVNAWLRKVQPNSTSLFYFVVAYALLFIRVLVAVPYGLHLAMHSREDLGGATAGVSALLSLLGIAFWVIKLVGRYVQRASMEEHFNGPEPIGLQLNPVMVFFFGGLYFQAKLNEVNAIKAAARFGAVRQY